MAIIKTKNGKYNYVIDDHGHIAAYWIARIERTRLFGNSWYLLDVNGRLIVTEMSQEHFISHYKPTKWNVLKKKILNKLHKMRQNYTHYQRNFVGRTLGFDMRDIWDFANYRRATWHHYERLFDNEE
mgnify:FL=1